MEDRLRFRIWQNPKDSNNSSYPMMLYGIEETYDLMKESRIKKSDDYIFMQCTGLKDKNGKLIYENDIIKVPFLDPIFKNVISDKNTELAIIEYFNGCFTAKYVDDNTRVYLYQFNEKIEVVGNILEDEELLSISDKQ